MSIVELFIYIVFNKYTCDYCGIDDTIKKWDSNTTEKGDDDTKKKKDTDYLSKLMNILLFGMFYSVPILIF